MADRRKGHEAPDDTEQQQTEPTQAQRNGQHQIAGRGWHGNSEGHAEAGRKGGQKIARNREHMAAIGRKGGVAVSRDRQHMADIGRKGGQARGDGSPEETPEA